MTLAAASPIVTYPGNGASNVFSFPFPTFEDTDIVVSVIQTTSSPNIITALTLGTDYSVSGLNAAGTPASSTGVVTLISAGQPWISGGFLASGYSLSLQRIVSVEQLTSIRNQGDYYPETIEDSLDYITMILQQLSDQIGTGTGALVVADLVDGQTYRIVTQNGVLGTELASSGGTPASVLIVSDLVDGHTYRLVTQNGVLGTELVS